jgi:hypothetical protein
MSLYIDIKYANIFGSTYLELFKVKTTSPYLAAGRCPVCNDSQKNKFKTRGYLFENKGGVGFKCHNCGHSSSVGGLIKTFAPNLYEEYRLESWREESPNENKFVPDITKWAKRRIDKFDPFKSIKKISQLDHDHPAKKYIVARKIPEDQHWRIYYADKYFNWSNTVVPDKFNSNSLHRDEPRIVLPFISEDGYCFGYTGRSINKSSTLRYATVMIDDSRNKVFGLDQIDRGRDIICVEGPIDSLFLNNCIAMAGADVRLDLIAMPSNMIIVMDNQPRNKEVVAKIEKLIYNGYRVCLWPENVLEKDINEMILAGRTAEEIELIIKSNTYEGLSAQIEFVNWKKI